MNPEEFKLCASDMINYIVDYTENIRSRPVLPSVAPGYLNKLLPSEAPEKPEHWTHIIPDVEKYIMPGLTHWHSPSFNAYFPAGCSYPSILGELLSAGIGVIGFNWLASPAITELEVLILDWLAKMLGLPEHFLASSPGPGGGVIQASGSEGILVALMVAKHRSVQKMLEQQPDLDEGLIRSKLVAYSSDQSNSAIEKAGKLGSMITRLLPADSKGRLNPKALQEAIQHDKANGLIPCYVVATLGTTGICAFDEMDKIGPICQKEDIWLHIDAAYAGCAFICPEFRHYLKGIEYADSFNMNPHKWLLVNFDCSTFWLKDKTVLNDAFTVERVYLKDRAESRHKYAPDFRNWEIPLGRRFRALKLWFTIRLYGVEGLQNYIRRHCELASRFEDHVRTDDRFELVSPATMGLVCFRLKGEDGLTKDLLRRVMSQRKLYMVGAVYNGAYFLRYVVCSRYSEESDVDHGWSVLKSTADQILSDPLGSLEIRIDPKHEDQNTIDWERILEETMASLH